MAKPSENISPAQLWAEITACPRPNRIIDFPRKRPGTDEPFCQVAMLVLTPAEQVKAAANAEKYVKAAIGTPKTGETSKGYDQVYDNAAGVETLYQCIRVAGDVDKHFFPSADALREVLTSDELAVLIQAYADMCIEIGPIARPDVIQFAPGLPKTRSGKIMRRILRKIAEGDVSSLGDTSTLAYPSVVDDLIKNSRR